MEHRNTAIEFATQMRAHLALACSDVEQSQAFYAQLLGQAPTKVRPGYAKFEIAEPPINLTLNHSEAPVAQAWPAHFGIQVKSTAQVLERRVVMEAAGFASRSEEGVGCCYAIQDKVWFADPDGNNWEVFVVTEADIPEHSRPGLDEERAAPEPIEAACCPPSCCS